MAILAKLDAMPRDDEDAYKTLEVNRDTLHVTHENLQIRIKLAHDFAKGRPTPEVEECKRQLIEAKTQKTRYSTTARPSSKPTCLSRARRWPNTQSAGCWMTSCSTSKHTTNAKPST